jgi:hypothetical protein
MFISRHTPSSTLIFFISYIDLMITITSVTSALPNPECGKNQVNWNYVLPLLWLCTHIMVANIRAIANMLSMGEHIQPFSFMDVWWLLPTWLAYDSWTYLLIYFPIFFLFQKKYSLKKKLSGVRVSLSSTHDSMMFPIWSKSFPWMSTSTRFFLSGILSLLVVCGINHSCCSIEVHTQNVFLQFSSWLMY